MNDTITMEKLIFYGYENGITPEEVQLRRISPTCKKNVNDLKFKGAKNIFKEKARKALGL
jgi:hypothetical protein